MNKAPHQHLEQFKVRALGRIVEKQERSRTYPIAAADLVHRERCGHCQSTDITPVAEVTLQDGLQFFTTVACNRCLYTYRSISPSYAWFRKCWSTIATNSLEVFNPDMERIRQERYHKYCELLQPFVRAGRMLDIGSGYGSGASVFARKGFQVDVVEAEDDKANYVEQVWRFPVRGRSIEEYVTVPEQYDLIVMAQCLEHLDDPFWVLDRIGGLLHPTRGILFLEVPVLWNYVTWTDALYLTHKSNFSALHITDACRWRGFDVLASVDVQQAEGFPVDVGLVLRPTGRPAPCRSHSAETKTVDDIKQLYRKNLPTPSPPLSQLLRYRVPCIEQFFCTVRLDQQRLTAPVPDSDVFTFQPSHEAVA